METNYDIPIGIKTGHAIIRKDLTFTLEQAQSVKFWKDLIYQNKAIFYQNAFDVKTYYSDTLHFNESIFKRYIDYNDMKHISVIELFNTGCLRVKCVSENIFTGIDCALHEIFVYEPSTGSNAGQTRIIYTTNPDKKTEAYIFGTDFNPNRF